MLRTTLMFVSLIALAAHAQGPQEARPATVPANETVMTGGGYTLDVQIPVDDRDTTFVIGELLVPAGAGPFPAVIILSGCSGVAVDAGIVKRINADYLPKGIAALVVDSFSPRGLTGVCRYLDRVDIYRRAEDAYAAMAWLALRSDIDSKRIFVQGYSHGAMAAIVAIEATKAATHTQKFAGAIAFYPYCYPATKFSVRTIILTGELDDWNPASLCQGIEDKTNVEVIVYPGASHGFAMPNMDMMYLGHRIAYKEAAAIDGQRRALALIEALIK